MLKTGRLIWLLLLLTGCTTPQSSPPTGAGAAITPPAMAAQQTGPPVYAAEPVPIFDFQLVTLNDELVTVSDFQGQWIILNFWATWCTPCRAEMPYLETLAGAYPEQLTVLAVNMRESNAVIKPFVDEFGITFPILIDPTDEILREYGVTGLPSSLFINPDGLIVRRQPGELRPAQIDEWIELQLSNFPGSGQNTFR